MCDLIKYITFSVEFVMPNLPLLLYQASLKFLDDQPSFLSASKLLQVTVYLQFLVFLNVPSPIGQEPKQPHDQGQVDSF